MIEKEKTIGVSPNSYILCTELADEFHVTKSFVTSEAIHFFKEEFLKNPDKYIKKFYEEKKNAKIIKAQNLLKKYQK